MNYDFRDVLDITEGLSYRREVTESRVDDDVVEPLDSSAGTELLVDPQL